MAFTDTQKDSVLGHLGYPVELWTTSFISDRLNSLSSISLEAETRVVAMLTTLDSLETTCNTYVTNKAGFSTFDRTTGYFQGQALAEINSQYRYWMRKLSVAVNIPVYNESEFKSGSVVRG